MNLNSLDLNLLVALDALLKEASVSRAAMRIGLSRATRCNGCAT
jgi:DNA-binding transcriptional LysR family regulator